MARKSKSFIKDRIQCDYRDKLTEAETAWLNAYEAAVQCDWGGAEALGLTKQDKIEFERERNGARKDIWTAHPLKVAEHVNTPCAKGQQYRYYVAGDYTPAAGRCCLPDSKAPIAKADVVSEKIVARIDATRLMATNSLTETDVLPVLAGVA